MCKKIREDQLFAVRVTQLMKNLPEELWLNKSPLKTPVKSPFTLWYIMNI